MMHSLKEYQHVQGIIRNGDVTIDCHDVDHTKQTNKIKENVMLRQCGVETNILFYHQS